MIYISHQIDDKIQKHTTLSVTIVTKLSFYNSVTSSTVWKHTYVIKTSSIKSKNSTYCVMYYEEQFQKDQFLKCTYNWTQQCMMLSTALHWSWFDTQKISKSRCMLLT